MDPNCTETPGIIYLTEQKSCQTHRLNQGQREALAARFGKYIKVDPTWVPGECRLKAQQYVGAIVLDDVRVLIQPKVPLKNLFYMLTYAYDLPDFRRESTLLSESEDLFEFVVTIFVKQVEQLIRSGLNRGYFDREENNHYLRGRLLLAAHLHHNAVHSTRFYQQHNEYTPDLLENQILLYTLHLLSRLDFKDSSLTNHARRASSAFQDVNLTPISPMACDQVIYTKLNGRYRSRINLAKLLLQNLSIEGHAGVTPFAAYILDMNQVFELFVARYLEQYFAGHPMFEVRIKDTIWLDAEQKEKGNPDIVMYYAGKPILILDTKYKDFKKKPSIEDRNQMLVYCQSLELQHGLLIFPNSDTIDYMRTFNPQIALRARNLPLDGSLNQFQSSCEAFASALEETFTVLAKSNRP